VWDALHHFERVIKMGNLKKENNESTEAIVNMLQEKLSKDELLMLVDYVSQDRDGDELLLEFLNVLVKRL
jgi:hypothetical protein